MRRTTRRWWRVVVVSSAVAMSVPVAPVANAASTLDVATAIEAWFRTSPVGGDDDPLCSTPAGCPAEPVPPAPPYPDNTLHVGATSGRAEAITYVAFATSGLPAGVTLTGGTARFPVAATEDGTLAHDAAELRACLVTERFQPAAGEAPDDAPEPDCDFSVPATYVADSDVPAFEVDLIRFVADWERPEAIAGLALVPAADATGTWHVAFSGRQRDEEGAAPPITATLTYTEAVTDTGDATFGSPLFPDNTSTPETSPPPSSQSSPSSFSTGFASAPATPQSTTEVTEPAPDPAVAQPAPVVAPPPVPGQPLAAPMVPAGYPYPVVWLLPLALAIAAITLGRSLTGEVEVLEDDDPRDLIGRLWLAFFPDRQPAR